MASEPAKGRGAAASIIIKTQITCLLQFIYLHLLAPHTALGTVRKSGNRVAGTQKGERSRSVMPRASLRVFQSCLLGQSRYHFYGLFTSSFSSDRPWAPQKISFSAAGRRLRGPPFINLHDLGG